MALSHDADAITSLTTEQFEQYQRQGYLLIEDALSDDLIDRATERLREYTHGDRDPAFSSMLEPAVEEGEAEVEEEGDAVRKFEGLDMVREDDIFREVAHADTVVSAAQDLLGPHLKLLRSAAMMKPPKIGSEKGIHQDAAYYPIQPRDHFTVWIPLDEATPENGCMQVVPGGHLDGLHQHEAVDYSTDIVIPEATYEDEEFIELPMEPGDVLLTHCLTPHKTAPNRTDQWRRALIMSYMHSRSRFIEPEEERAPYVDSVGITGDDFPGCV